MANDEKNTSELVSRASDIILPVVEAPGFNCAGDAKDEAFLLCAKCGAGVCLECLREVKGNHVLVCPECAEAMSRKKLTILDFFMLIKLPGVWVLICIVIARAAFMMGVGNPDIRTFEQEDSKLPWYRQRAGLIYLSEAGREKQRAAALKINDNAEDAARWSMFAAQAFDSAAREWAGTPVEGDLRIAQANMLSSAGKNDQALEIMKSLKLEANNSAYPAYLYYYGIMLEQAGRKEESGKYLKEVLVLSGSLADNLNIIDNMIDRYAGDKKGGEMTARIQKVCETLIPGGELAEKCRKKLGVQIKPYNDSEFHKEKLGDEKKEESPAHEKAGSKDFEVEFIKDN